MSPSGTNSTPPVLSISIIDLGQITDFFPFGLPFDATRSNPTYELYTSVDTLTVRAAAGGIVEAVEANPVPQTDQEIRVRPSTGSIYLVIYDHVVAPQVSVGQTIVAGQALGRIGSFNDPARRRNARVELQVNRGNGAETVAICPRDFGTAEFNAAYAAALASVPDAGATVCLTDTVKP